MVNKTLSPEKGSLAAEMVAYYYFRFDLVYIFIDQMLHIIFGFISRATFICTCGVAAGGQAAVATWFDAAVARAHMYVITVIG
jgi:hypothetical protein